VILAVDADLLVRWAMAGAPRHAQVRALLERDLRDGEGRLGLTPQVLLEAHGMVTDPLRFESAMPLATAESLVRWLWDGREVARLLPDAATLHRALELLHVLGLGRERLPQAFLAATLEGAGVRRLATLRPHLYAGFAALSLVVPS
jgi:predicted nucleic acid-binding protein